MKKTTIPFGTIKDMLTRIRPSSSKRAGDSRSWNEKFRTLLLGPLPRETAKTFSGSTTWSQANSMIFSGGRSRNSWVVK